MENHRPRLSFTAALWWCEEQGASWSFARAADGHGFELSLRIGREQIIERGRFATDWGWLLIDAVERYQRGWDDERPTTPSLPPSALAL